MRAKVFGGDAGGAPLDGSRPDNLSGRLPGALDEEWTVIWSGSKQRAGECAGLSSYDGAASIANARKLELCGPQELTGKPLV